MRHLARRLIPINIYEIPGTMCCLEMHNNYNENSQTHQLFCYDAKTIFEANVLIIWGGISRKLREQIISFLSFLPEKHALLHIAGCAKESDLNLRKALIMPQCALHQDDRLRAIEELRKCLVV